MMTASPSTTKLFHEKMSVLNKNFLQFAAKALADTPSADLTPTLRSYVKHVAELDKLYAENSAESQKTGGATLKLPQLPPKPVISIPAKPTLSSNVPVNSTPLIGNRKRRGDDSVQHPAFARKSEVKEVAEKIPPVPVPTFGLSSTKPPVPSFGFGSSTSAPFGSPTKTSAPATFPSATTSSIPSFGLNKNSTSASIFNSTTSEDAVTTDEKKESVPSLQSIFSQIPKDGKSSLFGIPASSDKSDEKSSDSNSVVEDPTSSDSNPKRSMIPLGGSLFGLPAQNRSNMVFPGSASTTSDSSKSLFGSLLNGTKTNPSSAPSIPNFGFSSDLTKPTTTPFTFGGAIPPAPSNTNGQSEEEEKEEPPKVELIEQKEDGALFAMKTNVLVMKDNKWEKMGVAYVNVMPGEQNKQLLVRAANTLGTIWINTHINNHFKVFLTTEKGKEFIKCHFPQKNGENDEVKIVQYAFRGGAPADITKLGKELGAKIISSP